MRAVWKANVRVAAGSQILNMPRTATPLCLEIQHEQPALWCEVEPSEPHEELMSVQFVGTGHEEIPDGAKYIGTLQFDGGYLVLHLYQTNPVR